MTRFSVFLMLIAHTVFTTCGALDAVAQSQLQGSGTSGTSGSDVTRARVLHLPPNMAVAGQTLELAAVVDAAWNEDDLLLRYRHVQASSAFQEVPFERAASGEYYATIPGESVGIPEIEYYIVGHTHRGEEVEHFASKRKPHRVAVIRSFEDEWTRAQTRRLHGYLSSVRSTVQQNNFGNRYGHKDTFTRAEVEWTHHLLHSFHAISVGYGFINGRTPRPNPDSNAEEIGFNYGYGGITLRIHPAFWIDSRAILGVSNDGFTRGGRIVVTMGKPWGASVDLGSEYIRDLGQSAWLRLQWDTVPRILMGATIVTTDLPNAAEGLNGSIIVYDIRWQANARMTVLASLSLGAREGAATLGGGFGTAWAF